MTDDTKFLAFLSTLGQELLALRESRGVTQEVLGATIDTTRSYISLIEAGKRNPSIEQIYRIVEALGARLVLDVRTGATRPEIGEGMTTADRDYLRELAALIPQVRDDVERTVVLRTLEQAATREAVRKTRAG